MIVAVVGSRSIEKIDLSQYLPVDCTEIVSGGAKGVDQCAAAYAKKNKLKLTEFLPEYEKYGKAAPLVRNRQIAEYADKILAFWDGKSKGTLFVIRYCQKIGKPCWVIRAT
jgi:predicted Rossmann fold nucleotide-binding protein DprA/Smf involved in DNA uptake